MKKRLIAIDGDVAYITLTHGQIAIIDAEDVWRCKCCNWWAQWNESTQSYYAKGWIDSKNQALHRHLMNYPDALVDHINGNTLDDRKTNLRVVTNKQNMENRQGATRISKTGVRGVSLATNTSGNQYYHAQLGHNGQKFRQYFPRTAEGLEDAERWIVSKREELHTHSDGR